MIRSIPASANRATVARASSGVPTIQRPRRASSQRRPPLGVLAELGEERVGAPLELGLVRAHRASRPSPSA